MSTEIKMIQGLVSDKTGMGKGRVICRFTSDKYGETLSLEADGVMITVGYGDVETLIKKARKK